MGAVLAVGVAALVLVLSLGRKGRADMAAQAALGELPDGAEGAGVPAAEPAHAAVGA